MVSVADRRVGACVLAVAAGGDCAGGLADLRAGAGANGAWTLAGLGAGAEEGPATGEGEAVGACDCVSFVGTLSTSGGCICGGEAAVLDDEAWGGDCCAGGTLSLIFPFDGRCKSLGAYCGTA